MAIAVIVEDGSIVANANSYGSVADADAYHTDRGNADWAALSPDEKAIRMIRATDYIDQRFGGRFIGLIINDEQMLAWPRLDTGTAAFDYNFETELGVIPRKLKYACFEYALRAETALAPDPVVTDTGVTTVTIKDKVGPIETEYVPVSSEVKIVRPYPGADMYLRGLVVYTDSVIR